MSYTKGPWVALKRGMGDTEIIAKNRRVVCECTFTDALDGSEFQANARLIAAAPDLLEALVILLYHAQETYPHFESERGQRDIESALDAIRKARGG